MTRHVIIGGGPAGLNAIETIRRIDRDAAITLVSSEPAYARMALPYFIAGNIPAPQLATGDDAYFDRLRVERKIGMRVSGVNGAARTIALDGGETLAFDTLLVATGSTPVRPPVPGADGPHVHNLWTLDDARAVLASAKAKRPSAVLVGGGFIGLIVLNALHKLGWQLTVVEVEGHILPRMLDRRAAEAAEAWLRQRGIDVYTGCSLTEIAGSRKKTLRLSDGTTLSANVVVLSTGIRPNTDFLAGSGVTIDRGVLVDASCRTNVSGIYAAGDVAAGPNLLGGGPQIHAIQTTAVDHGRIAGANMAGQACAYAGSLVMNILDLAGLHMASFGRWSEAADTTEVWAPSRPVYRKLVWDGTRLVGGIILGPIEDSTMLTDVGMLKGLIQSQVDLAQWKQYVNERPWDLRRAYVATGAAERLLPHTTVGTPAAGRGFHYNDLGPTNGPGPHHAELVGTRPPDFASLPRTPTPGLWKRP